jgi:hypothetical protein
MKFIVLLLLGACLSKAMDESRHALLPEDLGKRAVQRVSFSHNLGCHLANIKRQLSVPMTISIASSSTIGIARARVSFVVTLSPGQASQTLWQRQQQSQIPALLMLLLALQVLCKRHGGLMSIE